MTTDTQWQQLATALRELHRTLMERARREYEREHVVTLTPGELLRLLTTDEAFAWLRSLSEFMADLDLLRDSEPQMMQELTGAVRAAVEHFITPPRAGETGDAYAQHYWPAVQDDPSVAIAHAEVKRVLASWPPQDVDAADGLHERHRIAEKVRHSRGRD
jgi:hypothetical protein